MSAPCYVVRSTKVAARMVGEELMIMSGRDSTLFALNGAAALIWKAADGLTPLADIVVEQVCTTFDVDAATAHRDASELVKELAEHGLLLLAQSPFVEKDSRCATPG